MSHRRNVEWVYDGECKICVSHASTTGGYTTLSIKGKMTFLHRAVWESANGIIPDGMIIRHRCDRPGCFLLDHLELGTHADNRRDMISRGRANNNRPGCENHYNAILTRSEVAYIRFFSNGKTGVLLAKELGVRTSLIYHIRTGRTWKGVTENDYVV